MAKSPFAIEKASSTKEKQDPKNDLGLTPEEQAATSGADRGTPKAEQQIVLEQGVNDVIVKQHNNAIIQMVQSGPGPNRDEIRITTGEGSAMKDIAPVDKKTKEQLRYSGNPTKTAASAIIIGSKTDVAKKAGIAAGSNPHPDEPQANIFIGSDYITLDGTSGIKLVTKRKPTNAKGGAMMAVSGIEIIAGNDDSDLQPLVKGDNLADALDELSVLITNIVGTMHAFFQTQNQFNIELKGHRHMDILTMMVGTAAGKGPTGLSDGKTQESIEVQRKGNKTCSDITEYSLPDCETHIRKLKNWSLRYLSKTDQEHYINSNHNKVN